MHVLRTVVCAHGDLEYAQTRASHAVLLAPQGFTGVIAGSNVSSSVMSRSFARGALASLAFVLMTYVFLVFVLASSIDRGTLKADDFVVAEVSSSSIRHR